jgi:hypothetical protein
MKEALSENAYCSDSKTATAAAGDINALVNDGIANLDEVPSWSDRALLLLPQFGPAFLAKIRSLSFEIGRQSGHWAGRLWRPAVQLVGHGI